MFAIVRAEEKGNISTPVKILILATLYFVTAKLGLQLDAVSGFATLVWPPTGISLAVLILFGTRLWPGIAAGAFLVNYINGASFAVACGISLGNTLEALLAAWLLRRQKFQPSLATMQDVLALVILAALLSTTVSATLGVLSLWLGHVVLFSAVRSTWAAWWVGDALGNLTVAPLILVWLADRSFDFKNIRKRSVEISAFVFALLFVCFVVFGYLPVAFIQADTLPYLVFPILFWVALRFGVRATVTTTFVISAIAIFATARGMGPFAKSTLSDSLTYLQVFTGTIAVTSLIVASSTSSRVAASAAKSAFLANMSHEIRTPLGAVLGFSELILNQELSDFERQNYAAAIKRNGQLLSAIINDILDLSKVEAGKVEVEKRNVSLAEVLTDITTLLNLQAGEKGIRLEVRSEGSVPRFINTDSLRLRQILINIVGNAIKFTQRGSVEVKVQFSVVERKRGSLLFLVSDTGPGIPPDQAAKLFEPFSQADVSTTRKHGGTGLGLVLSKRLAQLLGGDVCLTETTVGKGATFSVSIDPRPLENTEFENFVVGIHPLPVAVTPEAKEIRLDAIEVLVVDDSPDNRLLVSRILKIAGAKVETAENGQDALDKIDGERFDVVLMDLQMPVMDGYEAVAALRKIGFRKPVIALTAHALKEEYQRSIDAGFDDHVSKPIQTRTLLESIGRFVKTNSASPTNPLT